MTDEVSGELFKPEAVSADTRAVNEKVTAKLAAAPRSTDLSVLRDAFARGQTAIPASPKSPRARTLSVPRPGGEVGIRVLTPDVVKGVYLHIQAPDGRKAPLF